jgi:L,D-peptidoglycan transpeptidase YkuD (ErfK/YbiS/YcfS/YnhG family)
VSVLKVLVAALLALAVPAGAVATAPPAAASPQVYNPCARLSAGQTKFSGFGANRVTFATATTRNTSLLTITGCVRSGNRYIQEWQDWGYGGQYGFAAQNRELEDTYRSPTGSFSFTEALGRSNPGTALKYYRINTRSRWGGEWNRNYNQYFEGAGGEADENLWTFMNQGYYEQAAVINYNRPPDSKTVLGASYAIFFHAGRAPSAGCVSTSLATVTRLLRTNRPGDRIIMGAVDDVFTPYSSNPFGAITAKYARTGGPASWLGNPASREVTGLRSGGAYQVFRGGSIYWSAAGGARTIGGAVRSKWAAAGAQNGRLGYPTSDEGRGLRNGGAYQGFQGGRIHWSRATGAHITRGGILSAWAASGYERGVLGYPTSDEIGGLKDGGSYQTFQGGIIHWSPSTGARITRGAIRTAWAGAGSEHGALGYPTSNEYAFSGGAAQNFQGGTITWTAQAGARIVAGAIGAKFKAARTLGNATTSELSTGIGGRYQGFRNGYIIWHRTTGAHISTAGMRSAWAAAGGETGPLGFPTGDARPAASGTLQDYQHGRIAIAADGTVTVTLDVPPSSAPTGAAPAPATEPAATTEPPPTTEPAGTATASGG